MVIEHPGDLAPCILPGSAKTAWLTRSRTAITYEPCGDYPVKGLQQQYSIIEKPAAVPYLYLASGGVGTVQAVAEWGRN